MGIIGRESFSETEMPSKFIMTSILCRTARSKIKLSKLRRIMIVDDEEDVTFLFKIILEDMHRDPITHKVDSFNNSLVALENYREGLYDLIIIDIVMPKWTVSSTYKELRKKTRT